MATRSSLSGDRSRGGSDGELCAILLRDLYRGVVTWARTRERDDRGRRRQTRRAESEWIPQSAPELRIAAWGDMPVLLAALRSRQARRDMARREPDDLRSRAPVQLPSRRVLKHDLRERLAEWNMLVGEDPNGVR